MKGLYLYFSPINYKALTGVDKKVIDQINAFNNNRLNCTLSIVKEKKGLLGAILRRLPFSDAYYDWNNAKNYKDLDYIYIRKPSIITHSFINNLRFIRKVNPTIKILMEFPTYPYDQEFNTSIKDIPFIIKEKINRKKLIDVVDRVVIYSNFDNVFEVPTIKIVNGIDVKRIDPINSHEPVIGKSINICAVAKVAKWHGYDRFIKGLGNYYKKGGEYNICFHIVGDGEEVSRLEKLAISENVSNHVIFHGFKSGEELNKIYDNSDIAVEVLGMHRKNKNKSSSLKSREYLLKGIPIITSSQIDILHNKDFKYCLKAPSDESIVSINEVINFYNKIYNSQTRQSIVNEIREFAIETCDINNTMKPVYNYLYLGK